MTASTSHKALFIKVRARPGQRDALRALWEEHLKPRAAANPHQALYTYAYDDADPDTIGMFELYAGEAALAENAKSAFFADYMQAAAPLIEGSPEITMLTPIWTKPEL
jgi:quinol monooxygenase YgiN